jgi:hypothetical protein
MYTYLQKYSFYDLKYCRVFLLLLFTLGSFLAYNTSREVFHSHTTQPGKNQVPDIKKTPVPCPSHKKRETIP